MPKIQILMRLRPPTVSYSTSAPRSIQSTTTYSMFSVRRFLVEEPAPKWFHSWQTVRQRQTA